MRASRARKSVGGERTFSEDISSGPALRATLEEIIEIVWGSIERHRAKGRTVTLKLKYTDFRIASRARTVEGPIASRDSFAAIARGLLDEVLPLPLPIRLMGLTLSKLEGSEEAEASRPDGQLWLL